MIISRKRETTLPSLPLTLNGSVMERVETFKYLGVHISQNLSWSTHVKYICTKAKRILGLLYRKFYNHITSEAMLQLYISLVRPHVEYAATVWSPHLQKDVYALECVQKFALRMVYHAWGMDYHDLIGLTTIPTLEERRRVMRLCLIYKILNNICYFSPDTFTSSTCISHHASHSMTLHEPFCRTNSYKYSFVPFTINLWNSLDPTSVYAATLPCFKHQLSYSLYNT